MTGFRKRRVLKACMLMLHSVTAFSWKHTVAYNTKILSLIERSGH